VQPGPQLFSGIRAGRGGNNYQLPIANYELMIDSDPWHLSFYKQPAIAFIIRKPQSDKRN
jgi:hypothetical protein